MRVLLIEDDSATAQSIELMLKSEGFNVYTTDLGEEGVDLGKIYDYDLILLDLNLPDMSGMDVLRTLRVDFLAPDYRNRLRYLGDVGGGLGAGRRLLGDDALDLTLAAGIFGAGARAGIDDHRGEFGFTLGRGRQGLEQYDACRASRQQYPVVGQSHVDGSPQRPGRWSGPLT